MRIKLDEGAFIPDRGHPMDAGLDLRTPIKFQIPPKKFTSINTGVHVEIPEGYVGLITSKSGLMAKGITSRGTIDSSYRGPIYAVLYNDSNDWIRFKAGDKITQLVIVPCWIRDVEVVEELSQTDRGENGFGSTGP